MRIQDWIVGRTQRALDDLCRNAREIPADKMDFAPPGTRSVLSQMQEIAVADQLYVPLIQLQKMPDMPMDFKENIQSMMAQYADLGASETAARLGTGKICQLIIDFPDAALETPIFLPFGGGLDMQMVDVLGLHYWNLTYHLGQICQIQMILGDPKMH